MAITIISPRICDLDNMFYRNTENIISKNGKNTFITYAVSKTVFNQLFGNIQKDETIYEAVMPNEDTISFVKRGNKVSIKNKSFNNELTAFIAI